MKIKLGKGWNLKYSDTFNDTYKLSLNFTKKKHVEMLNKFIEFYTKYDTKGLRYFNDTDFYEEAKSEFDKVTSGDLLADVLSHPDGCIRNITQLMEFDKPKAKLR